MSKKKIYKSSIDGKFVSKEEINEHPESTMTQTVEVGKRKPKPVIEPGSPETGTTDEADIVSEGHQFDTE